MDRAQLRKNAGVQFLTTAHDVEQGINYSDTSVATNVRHATTPLPPAIWDDLDSFLATLGPWTPGGKAGVLA